MASFQQQGKFKHYQHWKFFFSAKALLIPESQEINFVSVDQEHPCHKKTNDHWYLGGSECVSDFFAQREK